MTPTEQIATLQAAMRIVSQRGDASTATHIARHIGALSVELATGGTEFQPAPGNRLHRMETR